MDRHGPDCRVRLVLNAYRSVRAMAYFQSGPREDRPVGEMAADVRNTVAVPSVLEASRLLEELRKSLDRDPVAAREGVERLATLLKLPSRGALPSEQICGGLAPWQCRKLEKYIQACLEEPIPVKTLAKLVSLSSSHFCRTFKDSYRDSPHAYILRKRIERAKELMLASHEPISQIALACGFSGSAHFANRFRQIVGEPPNIWRRANALSRD